MNPIEKPHFIFSVENPLHKPTINVPSHNETLRWLKNQGEEVYEAINHYGEQPERSIVVVNPKNVAGLQQFAQDIGQDSVLYSKNHQHELRYLNGSKRGAVVRGIGTKIFSNPPHDMYTTIKDEKGNHLHFQHQLVFDSDYFNKSELKAASFVKTAPALDNQKSDKSKGSAAPLKPERTDEYPQRHGMFVRDFSKLDYDKMPHKVNPKSLVASKKEDGLFKAVGQTAWNRILKAHNKGVREDVVDSAGHISYFNRSHKEYLDNVLNHPEIKADTSHYMGTGDNAKMIHVLQDDTTKYTAEGKVSEPTYMAKPYHSNLERWASTWQKHPIKGWASLTTRKLFESANIPHLCEDISAHIHNGVPLVISKFHPNATEFDNYTASSNPHDVAKLTIMDFLANNQDRHYGNIMDVEGFPLAIDHERNFQYFKHKGGEALKFSPYFTFRDSALKSGIPNLPKQIAKNRHMQQHLIDWWSDSGYNIKKEMEQNLKFIKDPLIKQHIQSNFNQRWEWVNGHMTNKTPHLMFQNETDGVNNICFIKPKKDKA